MRSNLAANLAAMIGYAFALGAGACGGGSGGSGGSVPLGQFPAKMSQAMCTQNFKCAPAADLTGHTMQQCVDDNAMLFSLLASAISSSEAKGRATYHAAQMGICIGGMAAMTCDEWRLGLTDANQPAACQAAIVGKVAVGGACQDDNECVSGTCEGSDPGPPPTDGQCVALVPEGGSCTNGDACATDFICDPATQVCMAKRGGGAACSNDDQCVNGCNTTTGMCSSYVGCAVAAAAAPTPAGFAAAMIAVVLFLGTRRRRRHA